MSLVTRLSLFFLGMLAVVLAGFSAALYGLASSHWHRQLHERLQGSLHVLTAAAEVGEDGLEWEPHERFLSLPGDGGSLVWVVLDGEGRQIDASRGGAAAQLAAAVRAAEAESGGEEEAVWEGERWRLARRRLEAATPGAKAPRKFPVLVIAVAMPLTPIQGELRQVAAVLVGLSLGLWLGAALVGRWLCRRALRPLTSMARAARAITADDLGRRLPEARTGDELRNLGRAFNDLLGRLQESFERQRRFTGDASHQLRTPLTVMLGQLEVALRRERQPDEYRRALGAVQEQAVRLRQLVEMLLFLARADAEMGLPDLKRLDLAAWLPRHLEPWPAHPRGTDLRCPAPAEQPLWVRAHAALLGQAIDNLLDNACKYSQAGSPITVRLGRQGEAICLEVADEGFGIAPEDLPRVFEPFFRSPQARRQGIPGTGLGLAVTGRIVSAMRGRVEVSSVPGQGSRFRIVLPSAEPEEKAETGTDPARRQVEAGFPRPGAPPTIL